GHVTQRLTKVVSRHRDKLFEIRAVLLQWRHLGPVPGIVNLKVAPAPGSDSTQIRPPLRSTIFLQSARPMPVPGISFPCKRLNMPNTRLVSRGSIPIPLSLTAN